MDHKILASHWEECKCEVGGIVHDLKSAPANETVFNMRDIHIIVMPHGSQGFMPHQVRGCG